MQWRESVDGELRNINAYLEAKELIVRLSERILTQFEGVELIDKYGCIPGAFSILVGSYVR